MRHEYQTLSITDPIHSTIYIDKCYCSLFKQRERFRDFQALLATVVRMDGANVLKLIMNEGGD